MRVGRASAGSEHSEHEPRELRPLAQHYLKDLVYGANDGIITTFAVVAGVTGAELAPRVVLILGFANLLADGFSMGASNFLAIRSEEAVRRSSGLGLLEPFPFRHALRVLGSVINVHPQWFVADVGLKALGMDHGNSAVPGASVWYHSDEHVTCSADPDGPLAKLRVGDRVAVLPAHVDPTMAYHERAYVVRGDEVLDEWAIDLRGW